ncbi:MAG: TrkH family potassium uptake protein [Mangrovicoccus sp.]|nr:TrkH family potassium uptake protein [Mangrovicoccus sp.]
MLDLRPVIHVIGWLVVALGATMLLPAAVDFIDGNDHWMAFGESALLSMGLGAFLAISASNSDGDRLNLQQTFLLTTGVWFALPVFAALPFVFGATEARYVDAFFEAMSGLTTTGSTVFIGLEHLPKGMLLWRALLQWFGGIGIIVVAMVFLPELRVGGMQIFRSEGFETDGKILPRATQIASRIWSIYLTLTIICGLTYAALGMNAFDAMVHAMTTIATGGFANYDASFGAFAPPLEYAACLFMILAALPFVRYVQILAGDPEQLFKDSQVRAFFGILLGCATIMFLWHWLSQGGGEEAARKVLFNTISILTGTGYASQDYMTWGAFPVTLFFFIGLIGGCAGSTACSVKVFRYQILFSAVRAQLRAIHSPHGMFAPRFNGRMVSEDVIDSVMAFFVMFVLSLGVLAAALALTGLDMITAISGAASALANIGPGLGAQIGPAGNFAEINDPAKWLLCAGMLVGRLELMVVYLLFTLRFWRA